MYFNLEKADYNIQHVFLWDETLLKLKKTLICKFGCLFYCMNEIEVSQFDKTMQQLAVLLNNSWQLWYGKYYVSNG